MGILDVKPNRKYIMINHTKWTNNNLFKKNSLITCVTQKSSVEVQNQIKKI